MAERVFLIVLDSFGIGEMPDAADFGDAGSLCHAWSAVPCYFMDKYLGKK